MKKRVKRSFKIRMGNRIAQELELPVDVIGDTPRITLLGSEYAEIKNHKGVFSYDSSSIRLETNLGLIEIKGDKLEIGEINAERLLVSGKIIGVNFLDIS